MVKTLDDEEKESIAELIREGKTLPQIKRISGRSRASIYRVKDQFGLDIQKRERESDLQGRDKPFGEADKVVLTEARNYIRNSARDSFEDLISCGRQIYDNYMGEAREIGISVTDYALLSCEFFRTEAANIQLYKMALEDSQREISTLKAQLNTITQITNFIKDMTLTSINTGRVIDNKVLSVGIQALIEGLQKVGDINARRTNVDTQALPEVWPEPVGIEAEDIREHDGEHEPDGDPTDDEPTDDDSFTDDESDDGVVDAGPPIYDGLEVDDTGRPEPEPTEPGTPRNEGDGEVSDLIERGKMEKGNRAENRAK